jgi:methyltransferase (TIGR00027 family)
MGASEPLIRDISDTARWVAIYRADESDRKDAVFRDPLARRLAGPRGEQMAHAMSDASKNSWAFVARTVAFDELILREVARGVDVVVNLAAGYDTRPYRLALPSQLLWIEVDLPKLIASKRELLADEKPSCTVERIETDLADAAARRELFAKFGARGKDVLIVTEGLLIYLSEPEVAALARDLAAVPTIRHWAIDLASPGLVAMFQRGFGKKLKDAGMPLQFGPEAGTAFFGPHGWRAKQVISMLKTGARIRRLPLFLRLIALLPEAPKPGKRPWSGVCMLERT